MNDDRCLLAALTLILIASQAQATLVDKCAWTGSSSVIPASNDVMMTVPVGDIDGDDVVDLAFVSFVDSPDVNHGEDGILRVVSGATCEDIWSVVDVGAQTCVDSPGPPSSLNTRGGAGVLSPAAGLAIGDLDDDDDLEIVAILEGPAPDQNGRIVAFDHDGSFMWCSGSDLVLFEDFTHVAIANLDGVGTPEIVWGTRVFAADGTPLWNKASFGSELTLVADVDGDGHPDVVTGAQAFEADGDPIWDRPDLMASRIVFPAVADMDRDGFPEVIVVDPTHDGGGRLHVLDGLDGGTRCETAIPNTSPDHPGHARCSWDGGGGPPTVQDVDGDGIPEIGVATNNFYHLFRFDPFAGAAGCLTITWSQPTTDCSSGITGSTITNLDGNCLTFEVMYNDELRFRIYDATDGTVLEDIPNGSGTAVENPVVADVDGDGMAEIVISANDYAFSSRSGVRVLHDPNRPWGPGRPIYNQHAYHVTNVTDDGTIPDVELDSWRLYNNYRSPIPPTPACLPASPSSAIASR